MGKPTGFLEYTRVSPSKIDVKERIGNYKEFIQPFDATELNKQAARCMDCGVPFCHHGCPLGNIIPEFNDAVYKQQWQEAYEILISTNNFPEFTGRICPAPCESSCVLGINQAPVNIEEIEKHIIEIAFEKGYVQPRTPNLRTGKKIAVVGSGPAGLAAAAQLNQAGHSVTVYERDEKPGGLLRYGIPDFKLEKKIVDRRIAVMEAEGITFKCNAHVGVNTSMNDILRENSALVLAGGSTIPRDLSVPGRDLQGIHFAMHFLKQQNIQVDGSDPIAKKNVDSTLLDPLIHAKGKQVVVLGGGDTGSDCVGTSNRQGAVKVIQFELLPKPPEGRNDLMPWPTYPMVLKTTSSHEEGCERQWAIATKEFVNDGDGNVKALKTVELEWKIEDGKPSKFIEKPGSEQIIECDLVLLAMGFVAPQKEGMLEELGIELDERDNVRASEKEFKTNVSKIFSCGDMRRGQSLVVWAISEGRECARRVDQFLMGSSMLESKDTYLRV